MAKHMNYLAFSNKLRPQLAFFGINDLETVAVFREPIDWLHSWYCYRKKLSRRGKSGHAADYLGAEIDFNIFVEGYLRENPPAFAGVGQQSRFVADKTGACAIDHLFKFTNLIGLQAFFASRLGSEFLFLPSNMSDQIPIELSPDLRRALVQKFRPDYDIYESIAC